jgi:hypothetical protein
MGNRLFGVDIAGVIAREIGPGVLPATLIKITTTANATNLTGPPNRTSVSHSCRAFLDSTNNRFIDGSQAAIDRPVCVIIGDTLPAGVEPVPGDEITIEDRRFVIREGGSVRRDPAGATFACDIQER